MQKRIYCVLLVIVLLLSLSACMTGQMKKESSIVFAASHFTPFIAQGKLFYAKADDRDSYTPFFIKGMNVGQTLPDTSLINPSISYEVYADWFKMICNMNINTLRVFSAMDAHFYQALADHNEANPHTPLYLMQGIWVNGGDYSMLEHAFSDESWLTAAFIDAAKKTADVLHGQHTGDGADFQYVADVSAYTLGYIIGSEWEPTFVQKTNEKANGLADFSGTYFYTENAQPFEVVLCEIGEALVAYETLHYDTQRPIAFLNWASTDTLTHPDEPFVYDDMVSVNTEAIKATTEYEAGLFAAVDAYPYYPEFMNVQRAYIGDENGKVNSFAAYLADLQSNYTVPLIVAEFGLSTARGRAHESVMGYHQGMLDETQQGEYVLSMMQDIHGLGLAGGFIFIWQDEWFKRTWNTASVALPNARYLNVQSAEQRYGIAAYEPGYEAPACWPDGSDDEWAETEPFLFTDAYALSIRQDEAYLYLLVRLPKETPCAIALGTTGGRGNTSSREHGLTFDSPADFLLLIDGAENTRLLTAGHSDLFHWMTTRQWGFAQPDSDYERQDNGVFGPIKMLVSGPMQVPYEEKVRPEKAYEAGWLRHGNANPNRVEYDSLADFCYGKDFVELRIPWHLLNILDPASPMRAADFFSAETSVLTLEPIDQIQLGLSPRSGLPTTIIMQPWVLEGYEQASYHLRLKNAYDILRKGLAALEK